jgi:hypothetical protein
MAADELLLLLLLLLLLALNGDRVEAGLDEAIEREAIDNSELGELSVL